MKIKNIIRKGIAFAWAIVISLLFNSCQTEAFNADEFEPTAMVEGEWITVDWLGMQIAALKKGNYLMVDDMIVDVKENQDGKSMGAVDRKWPDNTVYYTISTDAVDHSMIMDAMAHWEEKTNLRFEKRTNQAGYVEFRNGEGCSSHIGYLGYMQVINLSSWCTTGTIIHEIGHTVGLLHEHTRSDRDNYINVFPENVDDEYKYVFEKWSNANLPAINLTSNFDWNSIMMYGAYAFSNNGKPTIL